MNNNCANKCVNLFEKILLKHILTTLIKKPKTLSFQDKYQKQKNDKKVWTTINEIKIKVQMYIRNHRGSKHVYNVINDI